MRRAEAIAPLKALGATTVLDITAPDFIEDFSKASRRLKPRVFLDAVADQSAEQVFAAMPNGARWLCYGNMGATPPTLSQIGQLIFMDKKIEGFWLTRWMQKTEPSVQMQVVAQVQERFADGRWKTDISARIPLKRVLAELANATRETDGKIMIEA